MKLSDLYYGYEEWFYSGGHAKRRLICLILLILTLWIVSEELKKPLQYKLEVCNPNCSIATGTLEELKQQYPYEFARASGDTTYKINWSNVKMPDK